MYTRLPALHALTSPFFNEIGLEDGVLLTHYKEGALSSSCLRRVRTDTERSTPMDSQKYIGMDVHQAASRLASGTRRESC
jgi:hypothetical protein